MSKKVSLVLVALLVLLPLAIVLVQSVNLAAANFLPPPLSPVMTIKSDGSIDPADMPVNRSGNVYTLTGNITDYQLNVQCNDITVDGAGYTFKGVATDNPGVHVEANQVTVKNFTASGISVTGSFNTIAETNTRRGVSVSGSHNNLTLNNIWAEVKVQGDHNSLTRNILRGTFIYLYGSYNNIMGNSILSGSLYFRENASFNTIVGNTIKPVWEGPCNVRLNEEPNTFYLNNFINIYSVNVYRVNVFDDGSVGNYWSDYNGTDANHDGIGDAPYVIDANVTDRYPLMAEYDITEPPAVHVGSPVNKVYNVTIVALVFSVNKPALFLCYSLDGQDNLTLTGNTTLADLSEGLHNVTVYANDTFGNMETSETVTFTIITPEPFPTVLVAAASIATVALAGTGLLVYFKKRKR
jgi:hypothetical protein